MSRHALGASLLASAALLAGCAAPRQAEPVAPSATPPSASASPASVSPATPVTPQDPQTKKWVELQAGDCLAAPPSPDPAEVMVTVVDCAGTHRAETFLRADIPVNAALDDVASRQCSTGFADYTGRPPGADFTVTYLIDSVQDRTSNNPYPSTVICLLQSATGAPLTGSARR